MIEPNIFVRDFDRPTIRLDVRTFSESDDKLAAALEFATGRKGSGIIYAATRQDTETIAEALSQKGITASAYPAGLKPKDRAGVQNALRDGEVTVIGATMAYGMGIDKPDIRYVVHHSSSDSLDSYYQEIGRAGRDGEPAEALLLYDPSDLGLRRFQSG